MNSATDEWLTSARTVTAIHNTAECPSLSPDETRVAYKKDVEDGVPDWRMAVLDLVSGVKTVLPEERNMDDQVAWLDEDTLLYRLPPRRRSR